MAETRPNLTVVGETSPPQSESSASSEESDPRRRRVWLLSALAVLLVIGLVLQTRRVGHLEGQVTGLEGELAVTRGQVAAYESRMGEIRGSVTDLKSRLHALDTLVQQDLGE